MLYLKHLSAGDYALIKVAIAERIERLVELNNKIQLRHSQPLQVTYNADAQTIWWDCGEVKQLERTWAGTWIATVDLEPEQIDQPPLILAALQQISRKIDLRLDLSTQLNKISGLTLLDLLYHSRWNLAQEAKVSEYKFCALIVTGCKPDYQVQSYGSDDPTINCGVVKYPVISSTPSQDATRCLIQQLEQGRGREHLQHELLPAAS
jgi:hypothetical protein